MRLAAGGAPVAVEPVNEVKILPVVNRDLHSDILRFIIMTLFYPLI
jgi:hypothetical protein